jgi:hypothetical protein
MIDGGMAYSLQRAREFCRRTESLDLFWFEEPFEGDDCQLRAPVRAASDVRVACGEAHSDVAPFRRLVESGVDDPPARPGPLRRTERRRSTSSRCAARTAPARSSSRTASRRTCCWPPRCSWSRRCRAIEKVSKVYPNGFEAVNELNLDVDEGEFMVLVGPVGVRQDDRTAHGRRPRGDHEGTLASATASSTT